MNKEKNLLNLLYFGWSKFETYEMDERRASHMMMTVIFDILVGKWKLNLSANENIIFCYYYYYYFLFWWQIISNDWSRKKNYKGFQW